MTLHIYTSRETKSCYWQPWQWHKAITEDKCPSCKSKIVLEMLELGHAYRCLDCHRVYFMPVLGFGPETIFCHQGTPHATLRFLRVRAYNRDCDNLDDWNRDIRTGRFRKWPSPRKFMHLGFARAKDLAGL